MPLRPRPSCVSLQTRFLRYDYRGRQSGAAFIAFGVVAVGDACSPRALAHATEGEYDVLFTAGDGQ